MREITNLREIQRIEYNILCRVVDFFEEHGISYFLCGGTLLGAIRHNGFIPWDDDIDILVPREDYERFKLLVRDGAFNSDFLRVRLPGDKGYCYPFIKVVDIRTKAKENLAQVDTNVWIDIFPLDHFSDENAAHRKEYLSVKAKKLLLTGRIVLGSKNHPLHKRVAAVVLSACCELLGGAETVAKSIDQYTCKMNDRNRKSQHCGDGAWPIGMKDYFQTSWLFPTIPHRFEDREFMIPNGYHEYLTHFYGDYMTPPPENKRFLQHQLKAWWLSEDDMDSVLGTFQGCE